MGTIDATMKTHTGATGTFSLSMGTIFIGSEWSIACEGGSVSISRSTFFTVFDGKEKKVDIEDERSGAPPEVRKWGEALSAGERNEKQVPEEHWRIWSWSGPYHSLSRREADSYSWKIC